MKERRSPDDAAMTAAGRRTETVAGRADAKARESFAAYDRFRSELDRFAERARPYLDDPEIPAGTKAAVRTLLNAGIAVGDFFPGYGLALSGGADAAKVVARAERWAKRQYVRWIEKGNPDDVRTSVIDLTPDVNLRVALGSELLELVSLGIFPTHAIEAGLQLYYHDWPRMRRAVERVREIAAARAETSAREKEAMEAFDVDPDQI